MNRKQRRAQKKSADRPAASGTGAASRAAQPTGPSTTAMAVERARRALADGRPDEAAEAARSVLTEDPAHAHANLLFGAACYRLGRLPEAETALRTALNGLPRVAAARDLLGGVLQGLGRWSEAAAAHRQALALAEDDPTYLSNLGLALLPLGRTEEAVECLRRAAERAPDNLQTRINLGNALVQADEPRAAIAVYERVLSRAPSLTAAAIGLGFARYLSGDPAGALQALDRAAEIGGETADVLAKRALVLRQLGRTAESRAALEQALQRAPSAPEPMFLQGLARLERGSLTEGWAGYAQRFATGRTKPDRRFPIPLWTGEALSGRSLLVWPEQGVGDQLLFGTCLPDLIGTVDGPVLLEGDPRLLGFYRRTWPNTRVRPDSAAAAGGAWAEGDPSVHCPVGTLPRLFRPSLSRFKRTPRASLAADPVLASLWQRRLEALGPGLRIGLCWRSRLRTAKRNPAYALIDSWQPLLAVPGVHWISLQSDAPGPELEDIRRRLGVGLASWSDTDLHEDLESLAALLVNLDLVVSAPTAVAELAGALGLPVWRATAAADWTQLGTACRPWFPSQRVWGPQAGGGLPDLLRRLARTLTRLRSGIGP